MSTFLLGFPNRLTTPLHRSDATPKGRPTRAASQVCWHELPIRPAMCEAYTGSKLNSKRGTCAVGFSGERRVPATAYRRRSRGRRSPDLRGPARRGRLPGGSRPSKRERFPFVRTARAGAPRPASIPSRGGTAGATPPPSPAPAPSSPPAPAPDPGAPSSASRRARSGARTRSCCRAAR